MTASMFVRDLNQRRFSGKLAAATISRLEALPDREDARAFLERGVTLMQRAGMPAQDFSPFQAELFASVASHLLPGCWGGRVPPITLAGRHARIDQLVRTLYGDSGRLLDIACGFPPLTTIDSSSALGGWDVVGVDRSLPEYLVHDRDGNYCLYDEQRRALYFQPLIPTTDSWEALLGDAESSARRFEALLAELLRQRGDAADAPLNVEHDGCSLSVHPVHDYEWPNLRFLRSDLESLVTEPADIVRCFNMLMYFDEQFRQLAMERFARLLRDEGRLVCGTDWAWTTEARYSSYVKRDGAMVPVEFAFSLDNLTPIGVATWYTLHADEREASLLAGLCATLRADADFSAAFADVNDRLRAKHGLCPRLPDGYFSGSLPAENPAAMWHIAGDYSVELGEALADQACRALARAGRDARVNEIGHVAVAIA
ncbi:MAG TPA: CheR family methyltransferase [Vicinamibacterales bacterium]|nr:CheR family methyltransferase [Vicinamibacterales bacterium]